ncbi:hypothetical protein AB0P36_21140 [Streptomyces flavidovirens]|uniref:hypothetical protein n=1 Tax=Streptomyces flavidovirens TaxID=67298 RepID=UPI003448B31A
MSAAVNYAVIGLPQSEPANALHHAVSGLVSGGFIARFAGLLAHQRKSAAAARKPGSDADSGR